MSQEPEVPQSNDSKTQGHQHHPPACCRCTSCKSLGATESVPSSKPLYHTEDKDLKKWSLNTSGRRHRDGPVSKGTAMLCKPGTLSLIPKTHRKVAGINNSPHYCLLFSCVLKHMHPHTMYTHNNSMSKASERKDKVLPNFTDSQSGKSPSFQQPLPPEPDRGAS